MSVKKYKSATAIDAEITKLLEAKKSLASGKSEVFRKVLLTPSFEGSLVEAEDAELRELAKLYQKNFSNFLAQAKRNVAEKRANKNPKDVPVSAKTGAASNEVEGVKGERA